MNDDINRPIFLRRRPSVAAQVIVGVAIAMISVWLAVEISVAFVDWVRL